MTMTVSRLHKLLGALIEAGHGRKTVLVDRSTFRDPRDNDGLLMLPPWDVQGPRWIPTADDDGGTKWNRDGTEAGKQCVLIVGDCADPEPTSGVPGMDGAQAAEKLREETRRHGHCGICGALYPQHHTGCGEVAPIDGVQSGSRAADPQRNGGRDAG